MVIEAGGYWRGRVALVTGIGGFVGGALAAALLERGATVVGVLRDSAGQRLLSARGLASRVELVTGSLVEPGLAQRAINEYDVDTVFHLAAQTLVGVANRSPLSTFESNVAGTWHLLEAARLTPCVGAVIVASSDKAYGSQRVLPYTEDTRLDGAFPYDASKVCTEVVARSYAATFGLAVGITRCANIYGPGDLNWSRLIPGTIRSVLAGTAPVIRSDGTPERDYLFVDDAVAGYLALAESLPATAGRAFNFGSGQGVSALTLVRRVLDVAGTPSLEPVVLGTASGEIDRQALDSSRARDILGWAPRVGLDEGLRRSFEWYRTYLAETARAEVMA